MRLWSAARPPWVGVRRSVSRAGDRFGLHIDADPGDCFNEPCTQVGQSTRECFVAGAIVGSNLAGAIGPATKDSPASVADRLLSTKRPVLSVVRGISVVRVGAPRSIRCR
jgi:hypothetical protein